ncbi:MAG: MFS transporter [Candidatus Nanopelagicaceae bacterium]|nr:MFS transporter [Candidatus Nanopelagicaceae bacterium]
MIHAALERRVVKVLTFAQILNGIGVAGTVAAGSLLVSSVTQSDSLAGLAQTSAVLGAAAMALPLSRLTERGGRRVSLSIGYSIGVLGAALAIIGGTSRIISVLLLGTFLLGAASAAGYQARFAAVDLASPETRSRSLSIVVWGSTIGAVSGPNLMEPAGVLANALGLPKLVGPYLLAIATLSISSLIIFYFLRPDPYLTSRNLTAKDAANVPQLSTRSTLRMIRENSQALFAVVSIAVGHLSMVSIMVMTPIHMAHVDVTLSVIGIVISTHIAGMYVFSPLVGYLSDRIGRKRVIQIGLVVLLLAASISGNSSGDSTIPLGFGLFLLGVGWSCTLIAGSALLSESVEDDERASSQGASDFMMNLTGAIGGVMAGIAIALLSYGWLCALASLPVLVLAAWSYRLGK